MAVSPAMGVRGTPVQWGGKICEWDFEESASLLLFYLEH